MADVRPFYGVRYNQSVVKDVAAVICPPYDIISPQGQQELYQRSDYNFVRLEFTRELPQDTPVENKYTRAAATLKQWLELGVLQKDQTPAFYLHDHYFTLEGKEYKRRNIVARVRLEEWDKKVVRPHEGTMARPKSDRLSLLWALEANTSSVLVMFADKERQIVSVLAEQAKRKPVISCEGGGQKYEVWAITQPDAIVRIGNALSGEPLYIADGHHRYESALTYKRERAGCAPAVTGEEGFNFVMMTLVDFADPGLVILPPHRLVRGVPKAILDELRGRLERFFEVETTAFATTGDWSRLDKFFAEARSEVRLALFGPGKERLYLLILRNFADVSQMMPYFHSELYKKLDVSVVDHVVLEELLGLREKEGDFLGYSYDRAAAVSKVIDQEYQLTFLLRPVQAETIKAIADAGDRMPKKSTYFHPKAPSGLVFYRLV